MPICEEKDEEDALPKDHIFLKLGNVLVSNWELVSWLIVPKILRSVILLALRSRCMDKFFQLDSNLSHILESNHQLVCDGTGAKPILTRC